MRSRNLVLLLLLYVALAWVWSAYKFSGDELVNKGLFWTAAGIGLVLAALIAERLWRWLQKRKSERASHPAPKVTQHEDDVALSALWEEARANLAASPAYGSQGRNLDLASIPLYLVVGPSGGGKTRTLLTCGADPQLLAGQTRGEGEVAPTRLANFFLSRDALFVDVGGRIWEGDLERWAQFLKGFTNQSSGPWWRRLQGKRKPTVRGVVLFQDVSWFPEKADLGKVVRQSQRDQQRLQAICETLGASLPVYAVFSRADALPFFGDFFARFPDSDCAQPLGTTLEPPERTATADQVTKAFTKAFNGIGARLADRRVLHLSRESDQSRKPGVYEFPREFRRTRVPLVQFLSEVFRPNPLKLSPLLRGFYFTGLQLVEAAPQPAMASALTSVASLGSFASRPDATTLFRPEATQIFQAGSTLVGGSGTGLRQRSMFARELFERILPLDRLQRGLSAAPVDDRPMRFAAAAACGVAAFACAAWIQSWWLNRDLISEARQVTLEAAAVSRSTEGALPMDSLRKLDALRTLAVRLGQRPPMRMRWGLYAGPAIEPGVRSVYFDRFSAVLLDDLNRLLADRLSRLTAKPSPTDPFEPAFSELATHLKITSGSCQTDREVVAGALKAVALESGIAVEGAHQELVDRQIEFFAASLGDAAIRRIPENTAAVENARSYLTQLKSPERVYTSIRSQVSTKLGGEAKLTDLTPDFPKVMTGQTAISAFYTAKGREEFEKELKNPEHRAGGDACALGGGRTQVDEGLISRLRELYVEDYKSQWKQFLTKVQVHRYANRLDAAQKLEVLSSQRSPMLGVLAFTANNTYFAKPPGVGDIRDSVGEKFQELISKKTDPVAKKLGQFQREEPKDPLVQVTESFQPVHAVVAPASDMWVAEANKAYLNALAEFRLSLLAIARSTSSPRDPALDQAALGARDRALETVRQLALSFQPVGTDGIDTLVRELLEQPLRNGSGMFDVNPEKALEAKLNGQLAGLCATMRPVLQKYPFNRGSEAGASLEELAGLLAPEKGAIWKYQQESLGEFVVRQEGKWVRKPDGAKPRISDEVLNLLNRAQQISGALHSGGSALPRLRYSLRPLGSLPDQTSFEFNFDGRPVTFSPGNSLQREFQWPSPAGISQEATAHVSIAGQRFPFARGAGLWGVFRVFQDAEPRPLGGKDVEWRRVRVAGGQTADLNPPVRMQFVDLPAGSLDLFNPLFFGGLGCPSRAAQ